MKRLKTTDIPRNKMAEYSSQFSAICQNDLHNHMIRNSKPKGKTDNIFVSSTEKPLGYVYIFPRGISVRGGST